MAAQTMATRPRRHTPCEETLSIEWQYPPGLIGLSFINTLFRLTTLGIYHFWAKTEVRQRIWSAIRINDEPLTYTGRGMELFVGFLIVFCAQPASVVGNPAAKLTVYLIPLMFLLGPMLLAPITQARSTGYVVRNLSISGTVPIDEIIQTAGADVRYGEGLAEAFDIDAV